MTNKTPGLGQLMRASIGDLPTEPWEIDIDSYGDELWFGGEGKGLMQINSPCGPWYTGGGMKDKKNGTKLEKGEVCFGELVITEKEKPDGIQNHKT